MYNQISGEKAAKLQKVNPQIGLSKEDVSDRLTLYGENKLQEAPKKSLIYKFFQQIMDPMILILLAAAVISFFTEWLSDSADYIDPIIILLIVVLNASIGIFQENKAEKALDALKSMLSPSIMARRDQKVVKLPSSQLVPGDIILLEAGDLVPADCRLLSSIALSADESALTGESMGVSKDHAAILPSNTPLGDQQNMLFSSSLILTGRGEALVVATGMSTEVGKIANMLMADTTPPTPLQQKLAKTGKALGTAALVVCGLVFLVGILHQIPATEMFLTSVSLAVAAIPEGLPAIVTIMLALGVQKMANRRAIIRKLPAVETLGSASVICSDKTGTITQNKMTVTKIKGKEHTIYPFSLLCNNLSSPTEIALAKAAEEKGHSRKILEERFPRINEIPFDSKKKWMATLHKNDQSYRLIVKGAPDIIIEMCHLPAEKKEEAYRQNAEMGAQALRVIAFAYHDYSQTNQPSLSENPSGLTFAGLAGMIDPPRPEVEESIKKCKDAGIKVVMITGDHSETAAAIAKEVGILTSNHKVMNGTELSRLTDKALADKIQDYSVFARVSPKDKVRIVKAFQEKGYVVSMTGDGVNDAPALKAADIGCAMGLSGTEVAKSASDMVLADDNFATIVSAVEEGRGIYDNIRKSIHFLLSSNIGEIITIFVAILIGWQSPLLAVQLLWVNLVTDSLPAIALGVDQTDKDIMKRSPLSRKKGLFADGLSFDIFIEGAMIGTLALYAFSLGCHGFGSLEIGRTMAFCVLSLSQIVHAFNMRSERSLFQVGIFSNPHLIGAFFLCGMLQIVVVSVPTLAVIFKVVPLEPLQWAFVAILSFIPLLFVETEKFLARLANQKSLKKLSPVHNKSFL